MVHLMKVNDLLQKNNWWMEDVEDADIVISSRVRLARNLEKFTFPHRAKSSELKEVEQKVLDALAKANSFRAQTMFEIDLLSELERSFLVERHLVSTYLAETKAHGAVVIGKREKVSVMINEEDHLRIQVFGPGFDLTSVFKAASLLDDEISSLLDLAYSPDWGYLTSCPTNVGTGMRASVMMHLPCLVQSRQSQNIFDSMAKLGLTIRGLYGEGTAPLGHIFQISESSYLR